MSLAQVFTEAISVCGSNAVARLGIESTLAQAGKIASTTKQQPTNDAQSVESVVSKEERDFDALERRFDRLMDVTHGSTTLTK